MSAAALATRLVLSRKRVNCTALCGLLIAYSLPALAEEWPAKVGETYYSPSGSRLEATLTPQGDEFELVLRMDQPSTTASRDGWGRGDIAYTFAMDREGRLSGSAHLRWVFGSLLARCFPEGLQIDDSVTGEIETSGDAIYLTWPGAEVDEGCNVEWLADSPKYLVLVSPSRVQQIQNLLAAEGYDPGPAHGIPDERTLDAIKRFGSGRAIEGYEWDYVVELIAPGEQPDWWAMSADDGGSALGTDTEIEGWGSRLQTALFARQEEEARQLVTEPDADLVSPLPSGESPAWLAAQMRMQVLKDILARVGHDETARLLRDAAASGDLVVLDQLLGAVGACAGVDEEGYTPLILAAAAGHEAVIQRLLSSGVDPLSASDDGMTALNAAVLSRNPKAVEVLLASAFPGYRIPGSLAAPDLARFTGQLDLAARLDMASRTDDTARAVQQRLANFGFNLAVDGIIGPQTLSAVRQFQEQFGLPVSAQLDNQAITSILSSRSEGNQRCVEHLDYKHQPGDEFRDCDECPPMAVVPAGYFTMGSPESQVIWPNERPPHTVAIPEFALGQYEVTFDEWDACVNASGCKDYEPSDFGFGRGRRPVINVSWDDAQAYVEWLSKRTGQPYRLPSEAEWEYAARAGTTTRYSWGDEEPKPEQANFGDNIGKTTEVGTYPANPWGLYDMHGNVWEWVEDCWNDSYHGAPSDGSAWTSGDCSSRMIRGGSGLDSSGFLRSATRYWQPAGDASRRETFYRNVGFRVARTLH